MSDKYVWLAIYLSILSVELLWIFGFDKKPGFSGKMERELLKDKSKRLESMKNCRKFAFLFGKR